MYAVNTANGNLRWKFSTGGPILFSAAASRNGATIYFASNDSYAYAVNAQTGAQVWKSAKLPGAGFGSWWPVIYLDPQTQREYVLLPGSHNYRDNVPPGPEDHWRNLENLDREIWLGAGNYGETGGVASTWIGVRAGDGSIDTSARNANAAMSVSRLLSEQALAAFLFRARCNHRRGAKFCALHLAGLTERQPLSVCRWRGPWSLSDGGTLLSRLHQWRRHSQLEAGVSHCEHA